MAKVVEFILEYRENGERKILPLKIDFVARICNKLYNEQIKVITDVQTKWDAISDVTSEIAALKVEKSEGWKDQVKDKQAEIVELTQSIIKYNDDRVFENRVELVQRILRDNGYKQDFLFEFDFWNEQVDPGTIIKFLTECIYKDIPDDKKKLQ